MTSRVRRGQTTGRGRKKRIKEERTDLCMRRERKRPRV